MQNTPTEDPKKSKFSSWHLAYLAFDLGFIIALPLVALGLLGKYLDGKLGTEPWLTMVGIIIAIATTTLWMVKKVKEYIK